MFSFSHKAEEIFYFLNHIHLMLQNVAFKRVGNDSITKLSAYVLVCSFREKVSHFNITILFICRCVVTNVVG